MLNQSVPMELTPSARPNDGHRPADSKVADGHRGTKEIFRLAQGENAPTAQAGGLDGPEIVLDPKPELTGDPQIGLFQPQPALELADPNTLSVKGGNENATIDESALVIPVGTGRAGPAIPASVSALLNGEHIDPVATAVAGDMITSRSQPGSTNEATAMVVEATKNPSTVAPTLAATEHFKISSKERETLPDPGKAEADPLTKEIDQVNASTKAIAPAAPMNGQPGINTAPPNTAIFKNPALAEMSELSEPPGVLSVGSGISSQTIRFGAVQQVAGASIGLDQGAQVVQVLVHHAKNLPSGPIDILLSPEELGRVRLRLQLGEESMNVVVAVERPETLDLLRRNIEALGSELRNFGYRDVSFEFFGDDGSDADGFGQNQTEASQSEQQNESPDEYLPNRSLSRIGSDTGLDLRI